MDLGQHTRAMTDASLRGCLPAHVPLTVLPAGPLAELAARLLIQRIECSFQDKRISCSRRLPGAPSPRHTRFYADASPRRSTGAAWFVFRWMNMRAWVAAIPELLCGSCARSSSSLWAWGAFCISMTSKGSY